KEGGKYPGKLQYGQTSCKLLTKNNGFSLIEATIVKGIRHQIRVHASSVGLPIVGDKIYNKKVYKNVPNHLLFANKAVFKTPENKDIAIEIEVPFLDFLL
nr:hypothetical protein [Spirochaetota bacterium]